MFPSCSVGWGPSLLCLVMALAGGCGTPYVAANAPTDALPSADGTFVDALVSDAAAGDSGGELDAAPGSDGGPGTDAAGGTDAAPGTDSGAPLGPFGSPTPVVALNDGSVGDDDPTLTADMLEIFWDSARAGGMGGGDIWTATRASIGAAWGAPINVATLNSVDGETTPEVSANGLTLCFASNRPGGVGAQDHWCSSRPGRSAAWGVPVHVPELATVDGEFAPTVSEDGLYMIFSSTRPGVGDFDLYETSRGAVVDPWGIPALLGSVDTVMVETDPFFDASRTVLFFSTDRAGGMGSWDIWMTNRPTPSGPFGPAVPVTELNSASNDSDIWLSSDLRTAYFSSDRNGVTDLFVATR